MCLHIPIFNFSDSPKFEVYCKKIPPESSIHHELYHQIISYPDCKTKDLLPSLFLRVDTMEEMPAEWSDPVDINSQGTQVSDAYPRLSCLPCLPSPSLPASCVLFVHVCEYVCTMVHIWKPENNLWESVLSFLHMGHEYWAQISKRWTFGLTVAQQVKVPDSPSVITRTHGKKREPPPTHPVASTHMP